MTEAEWLACEDSQRMLDWLDKSKARLARRGEADPTDVSGRKLLLFATALLEADAPWRKAMGASAEQAVAVTAAWAETGNHPGASSWFDGWADRPLTPAEVVGSLLARAASREEPGGPFDPVRIDAAGLLREIVGNPFAVHEVRQPLPWLVTSLARAAYEGRLGDGNLDPVRLSVLADALEDVGGYVDERVMRHLRGFERCARHEPDLLHCRRCGATQDRMFFATHPSLGFAACGPCGAGEPLSRWPCPGCKADGWAPKRAPCVRGCFALDLILGLG